MLKVSTHVAVMLILSTQSACGMQLPAPNPVFQKALQKSPFTIFECVSDLGFYEWNPTGVPDYKPLATVTCQDIKACVTFSSKPKNVRPVHILNKKCPKPFLRLKPQEHYRMFPYHPSYLPPLYVATTDRKVPLEMIDFVFGGSALDMMATSRTTGKSVDSQYLAKLVPGTNVIVVARYTNYTQNYSVPGFQFERFVTGGEFEDRHDDAVSVHLHIMKVGQYNVLFSSETDALDENDHPIEIKTSHPANWGTNIIFQMMSGGSVSILAGKKMYRKSESRLIRLFRQSISTVINNGMKHICVATVERNILTAMHQLKEAEYMDKLARGDVLDLFFVDGELQIRSHEDPESVLLPPGKVAQELLHLL